MRPFELLGKLLDLESVEANRGLWVGFMDGGKPSAILPAGRPGEVCSAKGMSKPDFDWLIKTHNDRCKALVDTKLDAIQKSLDELGTPGHMLDTKKKKKKR